MAKRYKLQAVINEFKGKYFSFSNFSRDRVLDYPTNEHFFQAQKTTDQELRELIKSQKKPGEAKAIGNKIPLRPEWSEIEFRLCAMYKGLRIKFKNPELAELLCSTGDINLVEGNTWHDNFWGDCSCDRCGNITGANYLGQLLMKLRKEIRIDGAFNQGPLKKDNSNGA